MLKRGYKLIICVVLVATLFIGFGSAFASAEPAWLIRVKAGIAAAMLASQLVINPVNYALDDAIAEGIDPIGYVQSIGENPWESYLEQSVIKVVPDTVYIDGVPYSDIWLGPEAADKLRLAGLDFASAYNILNNQSSAIQYASGVGLWDGVPVYSGVSFPSVTVDNSTSLYNYPFSVGSYSIGDTVSMSCVEGSTAGRYYFLFSDGSSSFRFPTSGYMRPDLQPSVAFSIANSGRSYYNLNYGGQSGVLLNFPSALGTDKYVSQPFSFDYTSGVIDAPLDPDDGLLLRVPSSYTDPDPQVTTYNYDIHDLINIYPQVTQDHGHEIEIDPDLNPDFQTDIDIGNGVGDLIRTILNILDLLDNVNIDFAPEPDSPQPGPVDPDPAVPDTPVGEQDGTWLDELLRWIKQAIDTISQSVIDAQDAIVSEIQDLAQTISELPEQILEDIETGPSKVFRKALDVLKSLFLPLLLPIKAMMGLWHYVVEWIASINAPFLWIFGVMSGTSSNMVLPIYAVLAGSICIAIYKALGR